MTLQERFEQANEFYLKARQEDVAPQMTSRKDIAAFCLLDRLIPGDKDLIGGADHDIVFLDVDLDKLNENASDDDIECLVRCGVHYDSETESLAVFV